MSMISRRDWKLIEARTVTVERLIKLATGLKSEHGENPEYDRALVELVTEAGLPNCPST